MPTKVTEYKLPSFSVTRLKKQIKNDLQLVDCGKAQFETVLLDTFDWRLFVKNSVIENVRRENSNILCWRKFSNRTCQNKSEIVNRVDFAWDLPDGQLKDRLKKILDVRALIPLATVKITRYTLIKHNRDEKIVLRLLFEQYELLNKETDQYQKLESRIILSPVRGYSTALNNARRYLNKVPKLNKSENDIAVEAFKQSGHHPGSYTSSPTIQLSASSRTDTAAKHILKSFFDTMVINEDGIRKQIDSEFLHDFRVALRKTRSFCKQLKTVFDMETLLHYKQSFQWLSSVTGPARDMDVYLLGFDGYRDMLPKNVRDNIEPLRGILQLRQKENYEQLINALNSKRYADFKNSYADFINNPAGEEIAAKFASMPVKEFSKIRIWKVYKLAIKEGNAISKDSPAEQLHELRKTCKKLRYLLDLFHSLYNKNKINRLIKELKKLQDNLGEFNDLHVQIDTLNELTAELEKHTSLDDDTKHAMEELILHLDEQQKQVRDKFSEHYVKFASKNNKRMFRKLFKDSSDAKRT